MSCSMVLYVKLILFASQEPPQLLVACLQAIFQWNGTVDFDYTHHVWKEHWLHCKNWFIIHAEVIVTSPVRIKFRQSLRKMTKYSLVLASKMSKCAALSYVILNLYIFGIVIVVVKQSKQFEDVTVGSRRLYRHFYLFSDILRTKLIN